MKLALFGLVALISLVLGICEDDSDADPEDEVNAVQAALPLQGEDPNDIPPIGRAYDCVLTPGRGLDAVPASCLWEVEKQGGQFLVTTRETWLCEDFSGDFPNYPPCSGTTGFHEWEYLVDLERGEVEELGERGQFPPDYVE